jgi:hypothetical protein
MRKSRFTEKQIVGILQECARRNFMVPIPRFAGGVQRLPRTRVLQAPERHPWRLQGNDR